MKWEIFKEKYGQMGLSSDDRLWEYDNDGSKIYQLKCGFGTKTPWDGGYTYWNKRYGSDSKWANQLHYAVKGHLIPDSWSQHTVDNMVKHYTKRLWGNNERFEYTSEKFEKVWKEHK